MVTPKLFEKIRHRIAVDPVELKRVLQLRYEQLNTRLEQQLVCQRMTPEVLAKRCTL